MERHFDEAFIEYLDQKSQSDDFQLDQEELRLLANGLFKAQVAPEAADLLEEYLERFPNDADRPRVKLAVLNVRFLQRPTYALKLLAKVEPGKLAEDYREIYYKTARYAQQMIADGMVDVEK